jgi:hypothetical protein
MTLTLNNYHLLLGTFTDKRAFITKQAMMMHSDIVRQCQILNLNYKLFKPVLISMSFCLLQYTFFINLFYQRSEKMSNVVNKRWLLLLLML